MTATARLSALELVLEPLLEAYSAELAAHSYDFTASAGAANACTCGRTFATPQGLGLHRAAAEKRASKAYDAAARVAMDKLAAMTYEQRRELVDAHYAAAAPVELEGTLTLERPLTVHVDDDTAPELLPAGTAIGVASTDTDAVLTVLVVDPAGRQHVAGEAARVEVEAALRPAPTAVEAPPAPAGRPVPNLSARLRSIARRAESFGSYRDSADLLVSELLSSGRPAHIELGRQLEAALGRRGAARGGAGLDLAALKRLAQ